MLLLDHCRDTIGLKMGTTYIGRNFGYTTDPQKAEDAESAGAEVIPCGRSTLPAWEIGFPIGTELDDDIQLP